MYETRGSLGSIYKSSKDNLYICNGIIVKKNRYAEISLEKKEAYRSRQV